MVSPQIQHLARRLLLFEAAREVASRGDVDASVRVIEKFRGRLIRLAGVHGYRSLLSRALTLAKRKDAALAGVQIGADGALECVAEIGKGEEAGLILVAQLLELLTTFIGESLTLQLVCDAWPEVVESEAVAVAASDEETS